MIAHDLYDFAWLAPWVFLSIFFGIISIVQTERRKK